MTKPPTADARVLPSSNWAMLAFILIALVVTMGVNQEDVVPPGSIVYWLLILPALAFPLFDLKAIFRACLTWPTCLLVGMLGLIAVWHLSVGDPQSVLRPMMMVLILAWASSEPAQLRIKDLVHVYIVILLLGVLVYLLTNRINNWGPLPGLTALDYGVWRVSFFPNIAYSAFLSLFMVLVLTIDGLPKRWLLPFLLLCLFYVATSFVRTAVIGLALYLLLRFLLRKQTSPTRILWISAGVAVSANIIIALSPALLQLAQHVPFVSRLLLRGEANLDMRDIYIQLFRPWVWWQHIQIFASSPYLMGWGNFDFNALKTESLIDAVDWSDTVSMPTRLLASHGLPTLLFVWFSFAQLRRRAREQDVWACACFAPVVLTAMQWGSLFHPSDPMFLLFFLILVRGRKAFS